jgi:hypothetical protein
VYNRDLSFEFHSLRVLISLVGKFFPAMVVPTQALIGYNLPRAILILYSLPASVSTEFVLPLATSDFELDKGRSRRPKRNE